MKSLFSINKFNVSIYCLVVLTLIALLITIFTLLQLHNSYHGDTSSFIPLMQETKPLLLSLIAVLVLLLCIFIRLVIIHKRVVKRVVEIRNVINLLSSGKINISISQKSDDEFGDMEESLIRLQGYVEKVQLQAKTDPLTHLNNRRAFDETLQKELKRAKRNHHPVSLLILDIDYFKEFNDYYGHPEGDIALQDIARLVLNACPRENDFIARIGGDEFVIILPHTNKVGAQVIAERILNSIRELKIEHKASLGIEYLTLSIGSKSIELGDSYNVKELYSLADKALYKAKSERNHAVLD